MKARVVSIAVGLLIAGGPAFAQQTNKPAQTAVAPAKTAPVSAEHKPAGGKATHTSVPTASGVIPPPDRLAAEGDLMWLGNFTGFSAEEISVRAADALKAFQRRNGGKDTGDLTDQERALLADATRAAQIAAGWHVLEDAGTGARLGVPEKLAPRTSASRLGSRWSSSGGQVQIETFRLNEASLPALFDEEKKTSRRLIGYSAIAPNSFIILGEQHLKKFAMRAQSNGGDVRGVTVLYDRATEGTMAAIALAITDSFIGFPDPNAAPPGRKRGVDYGSAIVVSPQGDLLAPLDVTEDCQSLTIAGFGHADRIAEDKTNGLALLRLYGARNLVPAPVGGDAAAGADLVLLGVADPLSQPGEAVTSKAAAALTPLGLAPAPKPGFSGAVALDKQGRFAGVVALKPAMVAGAGSAPVLATLIPAAAARAFLSAQGIAPASGDGAMDQSVLRLICVRK
jgi:hypothetical protein